MASDDDKLDAVFDLDTKEALEKILQLKGNIMNLGAEENLAGLVEGLTTVGAMVGVLGASFFALKTTLDTVFEAESIKQINNQFELLTKNSGLATATLKEGLVEAAHGLVDDTDLMRAANKAIVEMGDSANKLPELMELARKSTAVFGGDALARFEELNHAIAAGSQRALKNMGIIVDVNNAYKDYAKSIGVAADQLSDAGKRQALLNAVLEKGGTAFKDVDENVKEATNTWKQLGVTISEIKEVTVLAFEKTMGPAVRTVLKQFSSFAKNMKDRIVEVWGEGDEQIEAKTRNIQRHIDDLKAQAAQIEKGKGGILYTLFGGEEATKRLNQQISDAEGKLAELHKQQEEAKKASEAQRGPAAAPATPDTKVDKQKVLAAEAKFQRDLVKLKEERLKDEMKLTQSLTAFDMNAEKQKVLFKEETAAKIKQINQDEHLNERQKQALIAEERKNAQEKEIVMDAEAFERKRAMVKAQIGLIDDAAQYESMKQQEKMLLRQQFDAQEAMLDMNKDLSDQQRQQIKFEMEQQYRMQLLQLEDQSEREREAIVDRWAQHGNNAAEKWAHGFASGSMKASLALRNFSAQGQQVFNMFTSHASNAFMELGEGSKKGSQIVREAMLGMIADVAQYYGQMMLAAGIFPPNPAALAAGAALLVLAGYLRGQARGKTSVGGGGGSVSGIGELGGASSSLAVSGLASEQQKTAKAVHLEIHGNVFDTDATKRRITELVREASDSTDFSVQRIGGGV